MTFDASFTDTNNAPETEEFCLNSMALPSYKTMFQMANSEAADLDRRTMIEFRFDGRIGADLIIRKISFEVAAQAPVPGAPPLLLTFLAGIGVPHLRHKS